MPKTTSQSPFKSTNATPAHDHLGLPIDPTTDPQALMNDVTGLTGITQTNKPDVAPPHVIGEQSVSGDMSDPESDDDMLLNSHQVGLRLDEDEENPKPLNIAADVAAAERRRRGAGSFDLEDEEV